MIRHLVFFRHSSFETLQGELVSKLKSLKQNIDYIVELEVGVDFVRSERSFDCALNVLLKSREDLLKYAKDPAHLPVVDWIKANGFETKVVDYDIGI